MGEFGGGIWQEEFIVISGKGAKTSFEGEAVGPRGSSKLEDGSVGMGSEPLV